MEILKPALSTLQSSYVCSSEGVMYMNCFKICSDVTQLWTLRALVAMEVIYKGHMSLHSSPRLI